MYRRGFFGAALSCATAVTGASKCLAVGGDSRGDVYPVAAHDGVLERLGGMTLAGLRDFHRDEIENEYVPVWDRYGLDHEYGGLIHKWDGNGKFTTDVKLLYQIARGLWVFSVLYNRFGRRQRHLDAARSCWEFIRDHCRNHATGGWYSRVTREGNPIDVPVDIYGDMYIVQGLAEYSKAAGEPSLTDIAIDTAHRISRVIVSSGYMHLGAHKEGFEPGTKILGTWQHFLGALTVFLRTREDDGLDLIARMCVRNIMERHFNREYGVFFEYLDSQFRPFSADGASELRKVSSWHSVQSAWICMDEALRRGDRTLFCDAMEAGRLTLETCWRDGDGLLGLDFPGQNIRDTGDKPSWGRHDDALVFAMLTVEHTHAPWACEWFDRIFAFSYRHPERFKRNGLLHHPRRLFAVSESLDRMIARGGRVSSFLSA